MSILTSSSRRDFLRLAAGAPALAASAAPTRPNVITILVDDMGFSDLGCYGSEIPTPNLDKLAGNGIRFTQMYNTARCSPSRACLLTGLYPHQAGMGYLDNLVIPGGRGTTGRLSDECVTMAEALKPAGYFTSMTGKWHLGQQHGTPPWERGFEHCLNSPAGGIYYPNQKGRLNAKFFLDGRELAMNAPELGEKWYSTDLWTNYSLRFIDQAIAQKKPFFHYLAHNAPHFPIMAPEADIARFRGKFLQGWDKLREARYERQLASGLIDRKWKMTERPPDVPAWDSLDAKAKDRFDHIMAIYAAALARVDYNVGVLVDGLKKRGVFDNTLILFMSDNGGNAESGPNGRCEGEHPGSPDSTVFIGMNWATLCNTPFRRYKHFTHEGGVATPLIAHWPAGIDKARNGSFDRQPAHLVDIMPTVLDATGSKYPASMHGKTPTPLPGTSLLPALAGKPLARKRPIFFMHEGNRAVREGKWKLVSKYKEPWELFDMEADRTELHNLAAQHPDIAKRMEAAYDDWAKNSNVEPWTGPARTAWGAEMKQ